jgi:CRISPR type IV-associated protein Csf3
MRYKLNIELETAINFIDPIYFDALLLSLYIKDQFGFVPTQLEIKKEDIIELPNGLIVKHEEGFYLASQLMYEAQDIQFTSYFTKHFDVKNAHFAKFKGKRKILVNKGEYKSYQLPQLLHSIKDVYFVFESDNIEAVKMLLEKHFFALGKKRNRGWGIVKEWNITKTEEKIKRFAPIEIEKADPNAPIIYLRKTPPYWSMEDAVPCAERIF